MVDLERGKEKEEEEGFCVPTTMQIMTLDIAGFISFPSKSGMQVSKG